MTCTSTPISPPSSEHRGDSGDSGGSEGGADGPLPNSPPLPISPLNSLGGTCMCAIHGRANAHREKGVKEFPISSPESVFKRSKQTRFSLDRSQHGSHTVTDEKTGAGPSHGHTRRAKRGIRPFLGRSQLIGRMFACGRSDLGSRSANLCARRLGLHRVGATQQTYPSISVPVKNTGGSRDTRDRHTESCTKSDTNDSQNRTELPTHRRTRAAHNHAARTTPRHHPSHDGYEPPSTS